MMRNFANGVCFACMGTCGRAYAREDLKVSDGHVFCADCYPKPLPAKDVKAQHVRGPRPDWRKR
jgi:hypothetical protein